MVRSNAVARTTLRSLVAIALAATLFWHAPHESYGQKKASEKTKTEADAPPDLSADLDEAIRLLQQGESQRFLERYAPVDLLRNLRRNEILERAAGDFGKNPLKAQLIAVLRALKRQEPRYDKSGGLATLEFDPFGAGIPDTAQELRFPSGADLKLTGLGDDLAKALAAAVKLLETGKITDFAERFLPASEVARLREGDQMAALEQQFKDTPELSAAMLKELKQMQAAKPQLVEKGQVALFVFEPADKEGQEPRTIKLQKASGGWRLYDDAPRVAAELLRQSKLKPASTIIQIEMELIGGNWRFVSLPVLGP